MKERSLLGSSLLSRLGMTESIAVESLERLLVDRVAVEREVSFGEPSPRHYILRLSPVLESENERGAVVGIVASLSDITKQRELQQMKTEVMALVTHELRTPLTAIQGMSEVLAQFDVESQRRREMNAAINDEAKRLAQMMTNTWILPPSKLAPGPYARFRYVWKRSLSASSCYSNRSLHLEVFP